MKTHTHTEERKLVYKVIPRTKFYLQPLAPMGGVESTSKTLTKRPTLTGVYPWEYETCSSIPFVGFGFSTI